MERLKIYEIINNMIDELERARDILRNNQEAIDSMLISDIDAELDRVSDLKDRIDFAMLMAAEIAAEEKNVSIATIYQIYELESKTELPYDNGYIDTEAVYNTLDKIVADIPSEL